MKIQEQTFVHQLKWMLSSLLLLSLLSSCELFKRNVNTELNPISTGSTDSADVVVNPVDTTPVKVDTPIKPLKVDTIVWTDTLQEGEFKRLVIRYKKIGNQALQKDTLQVIEIGKVAENPSKSARKARVKDSYNVCIILPFMANQFNAASKEIPSASLRAVEFWEGAKIALDSLNKEGIRLNIKVYDSQRDMNEISEILKKPEMAEMDLIFGPVNTEPLYELGEFGKKHGIPVISVFNPNDYASSENPYFIQVNPSFEAHGKHIANFLIQPDKMARPYYVRNTNLLMVGMLEDSSRMDIIQKSYAAAKNDINAKIPQHVAKSKSISIGELQKHFSMDALNVIVVPSYKDEGFIFSLLRELHSLVNIVEPRKSYNFLVIGMAQWKYFERVNFEYYENMNLHITSEYHVDPLNKNTQQFKQGYKAHYGIAPREFGYIGFDAMLYFGRLLGKYGTGFPDHFSAEKSINNYRHTNFSFQPIYNTTKALDGKEQPDSNKFNLIERFENEYLHLLYFHDYDFKSIELKKLQD